MNEADKETVEKLKKQAVDYLGNNDWDGIINACNQILAFTPQDADAYFHRGSAYRQKGDVDRAIEDYDKAIEYKPGFAAAYNNRGSVYDEKGDVDRAIEDYDKAIEYKSDSAEAYYNRGIAYRQKGDVDRAIKDFDKAIEYKPDFAEAYYSRGLAYDEKGDYDRAIEDYDKAIEYKPDFSAAYNSRGFAYDEKGDVDRAIEDYDKAIEYKSDYAAAYNNRGYAYDEKGDVDRAIEDYDKAIEYKSDYAAAYNNRGCAYDEKGDVDRAIEDYDKAIEYKSDYAAAYHNRGFAYRKKGDVALAIKDYDKAVEYKPDYAEAYHNRGFAYFMKGDEGDYDRAIEDYDKAIEYKPDFAETYNNRGFAYDEKGDVDRAIKDYDKAIEYKSDFAIAYNNRGFAYIKLDEYNNAMEDFSNAYKKGDKSDFIPYLACKIKNINPINPMPLLRAFIEAWEITNNIQHKLHLNSNKDPESFPVAHYCSLQPLKNIIKGERFRLYNVAYMNDPEEGKTFFSMITDQSGNIREYFYGEDNTLKYSPYYIGSFVSGLGSDDQISFWRTYGKDNGIEAAGCSLVFDQQKFSQEMRQEMEGVVSDLGGHDKRKLPVLFEVVYSETQKEGLKKMLESLADKLVVLRNEIEKDPDKSNRPELKALGCALIDSVRYLFKSKHYANEQEVRIVQYIERGTEECDTGDFSKFYVTPYDIWFSQVMLGPKTKDAFKLGIWIDKNRSKVVVKKSSAPYRW